MLMSSTKKITLQTVNIPFKSFPQILKLSYFTKTAFFHRVVTARNRSVDSDETESFIDSHFPTCILFNDCEKRSKDLRFLVAYLHLKQCDNTEPNAFTICFLFQKIQFICNDILYDGRLLLLLTSINIWFSDIHKKGLRTLHG